MARPWLPRLLAAGRHRRRPSETSRLRRPSLETLEDRRLLSVGNLDLTFGVGGTLTTAYSGQAVARAVAVLDDGRVLAAGETVGVGGLDLALARYRVDGSLDPTFGVAGRSVVSVRPGDDRASALALLPGGAFLVAGSAFNGTDLDFLLAKFRADGTLDPTFGTGGISTFDSGKDDEAFALSLTPTGQIVVAGRMKGPGGDDFAVLRFGTTGNLDPTFGTSGTSRIDFGGDDVARAVALLADGSVLVAGFTNVDGDPDFALAKLTAGGSRDTTFGVDGRVRTDFASGDDRVAALSVQPGGKIVAAGRASDGVFSFVGLARYDATGTLDPTFGVGATTLGPPGTVMTAIGLSDDAANALTVQPDGKLIVAGRALIELPTDAPAVVKTRQDFALVRYSRDGFPDANFGLGGRVTTAFASGPAEAFAVAATTDGRVVAAGTDGSGNFALARYTADLRPLAADDVTTRPANLNNTRLSLGVLANDFDPDGDTLRVAQIVTAGGIVILPGPEVATPDGLFGTDGTTITWLPPPTFVGTYSFTYTITDGWLTSAPATITVNVVDKDTRRAGDLDPTFGQTGRAVVSNPVGDDAPAGIVRQSNGKLVTANTLTLAPGFTGVGLFRVTTGETFDPTFGPAGQFGFAYVQVGAAIVSSRVHAVAIQADDKILVAGTAAIGVPSRAFVTRFTKDGLGDTSFGLISGLTVFPSVLAMTAVKAIVPLADGRFLIAGTRTVSGVSVVFLARLTTTGGLDATFGVGGFVDVLDFDAAQALFVAVQPGTGLFLLGGTALGGTTRDFGLARFGSTGARDTTFGTAGLARADFGGSDLTGAMAVLGTGQTVLSGSASNGLNDDFALARFTASGLLDTTFGIGGRVVTPLGPGNDRPFALLTQPDGKFVAAGSSEQDNGSTDGRNTDFAVVRYRADGSLDTAFGTGGRVVLDFLAGPDRVTGMSLQPDGKLVLTGSARAIGNDDVALVRLHTDGSLDTTFFDAVASGKDFVSFGSTGDFASAVVTQPDGKIVTAGSAGGRRFFALTRTDANAVLDPTFGSAGRVLTAVGVGNAEALALASQGTGFVAAGYAGSTTGGENFAVVRYTSAGAIDQTFGGGPILLDFGGGNDRAQAVGTLADGRVVVAGYATVAGQRRFALARLRNDGSLDPTFGLNGRVITPVGLGDAEIRGLVVGNDGSITAAGVAFNGTDRDVALVRFRPDGSLDSTFGTGGVVLTDLGSGDDEARAIAAGSANTFVVAGRSVQNHLNGVHADFLLARYTATGSLDPTLTGDSPGRVGVPLPAGLVVTDFNGVGDEARALTVRPDGTIVLAGSAGGGNRDFGLSRYRPDGSLDPDFGTGGKIVAGLTSFGDDDAAGVGVGPDGKLIVAGSSNATVGGKSVFAVMRFFLERLDDFAPVALDDKATTTAGVRVVVPVLANDSDFEGDPLSLASFTQGGNGAVARNPDGTLTYTPAAGFLGTDFFTYAVTDGRLTSTATVRVSVIDGPKLGGVIDAGQGLIVAERWLALSAANAAGVFNTPSAGPFAQLTTGDVAGAVDNRNAGVNQGTRLRGAFDVSILELTISVPAGANYLQFNFAFATNEYPLFRNRGFNDAFVAELDQTTWRVDTTTGAVIAPDNFAFDASQRGQPSVSAAGSFFDDRRVVTLTGTLYNGSTPLLTAGTPVTPGLHTLYLSVFDVGDGQIDSAVFVRGLTALALPPELATPGAHQPPRAADDLVPLRGGTAVFNVLENDLDLDGDALTLIDVTQGQFGRATFDASGRVTYLAGPQFKGVDVLGYTIRDARGAKATGRVLVFDVLAISGRDAVAPTDPVALATALAVRATATNQTAGSGVVDLTVADYAFNPVPAGGMVNGVFYDVRAGTSEATDRVVARFVTPAGNDVLLYWDGSAWQPVRGSGNTAPVRLADGSVLVALDDTSRPRVTGLHGTVFTARPTTGTPAAPPVALLFAVAGPAVSPSEVLLRSNVQISLVLTSEQASMLTVGSTGLSLRSSSGVGQPGVTVATKRTAVDVQFRVARNGAGDGADPRSALVEALLGLDSESLSLLFLAGDELLIELVRREMARTREAAAAPGRVRPIDGERPVPAPEEVPPEGSPPGPEATEADDNGSTERTSREEIPTPSRVSAS